MAYGVFGLNKSYVLTRSKVFSTDATHGWFAGGIVPASPAPSSRSTVERIDFSNDSITASVRGPLSIDTYSAKGVNNFDYGWFGGGYTAGVTNRMQRIDFSNDLTTGTGRVNILSTPLIYLAAVHNNFYGWFGGGQTGPGAFVSTIQRIDYANESTTLSIRGPLNFVNAAQDGTSNSNFGWFVAGNSPVLSRVERVDFSNDFVSASVRNPLSAARYFSSASSNEDYGWVFGGGNPTDISIVDRIDFSSDLSAASVRGPLSRTRKNQTSPDNSASAWIGGGALAGTPTTLLSSVDRMDFSNDLSTAIVRGPLTEARQFVNSVSAQAKSSSILPLRGGNFGWFGGGNAGSPSSTVDRIDFSNDSVRATSRGPLSASRYELGAAGNSNYGWFATGRTSSPIATASSIVDRVDFSNDSTGASVRGPLNSVRFYKLAATSNSNYGWFAGGNDPTPGVGTLTTVERIDFSNDLPIASIRGSLSTAAGKAFYDATGNSNYGWFGGAAPGAVLTRVDRLDYANDSSNTTVRGPMSATRYKSAATGNSNYGWWGGGSSQPPLVANSIVDRIDFSNDSTIALVRGPLSEVRDSMAATGNSNYGWWGGGSPSASPTGSKVERINFSNDSSSTSIRGPLSQSRLSLSASSNVSMG